MPTSFEKKLTAIADTPDSRDFIFEPSLNQIANDKFPTEKLNILNQGREASCVGHALAAAINYLNQKRDTKFTASRRMLYEMARKNDEWPGEDYEGSSIRGAIKGWKNMGVCSEELYPYTEGSSGMLNIEAAKEARSNGIGAYYRLAPNLSHFHAALNESGVIIASANVHSGWNKLKEEEIPYNEEQKVLGGHAFAIVGYNSEGFRVQNSWGKSWADSGKAIWKYEDWVENIMDAWIVTLALPVPQVFGKEAQAYRSFQSSNSKKSELFTKVNRSEIAGHFVHIDDGQFCNRGRYWSNEADIKQTAELVANSDKYDHLMIFAHGGLNSPAASANRIKVMKDGFKRNGIYPFHLMYDTGLAEELKDIIFRRGKASQARVGGFSDWTDKLLERALRKPGTLIWDEMKNDAKAAFLSKGAGLASLNMFISALQKAATEGRPKKIHIVGHSTGGILIAYLLRALQDTKIEIESCSLLAPAITIKLYKSHYLPILQKEEKLTVKQMDIYNMTKNLEKDDNVAKIYRKSLLYLVSNSFERAGKGTPLLGLERDLENFPTDESLARIHYSNGQTSEYTLSNSHGGFDNDPVTMNHILKCIKKGSAISRFTYRELNP
jgi:hypothetical protein